ncbi:type II toxin-antitoxin system HicB family antitoxin [Synechococcales cyanobacterium C]|uniref:Type II toxin-antitoxin system HicB family antitoxin n=1 Tax=Petrachloros mirabilis ULC683 TaxID=2781853 RepID=A0A8K1ZY96_9CYAN|nr:type II toxin-antitoxin system HicB family antitoxin [Petrachloros mirabilis]NCJ07515.1 type II toxin-antitoxin system HicB family antitoxin [Petrachloros mirabilis ULC683]
MLTEYIRAVMRQAQYRLNPVDDCVYGEVPGFVGVSACALTLEQCQQILVEALEEWIFFRVSRNLPVPDVDGIHLSGSDSF